MFFILFIGEDKVSFQIKSFGLFGPGPRQAPPKPVSPPKQFENRGDQAHEVCYFSFIFKDDNWMCNVWYIALIFTFRTAIKSAMPAVLVVVLAVVPSQKAFPAVIVVVVLIRAHTRVRVLGLPIVDVGLVAALIRVTAVTPSAIAVEIVTLTRTITINVEVLTYFYIFYHILNQS